MKKIRIGNDIRLAVDLRQYLGDSSKFLRERSVYNPGDQGYQNLDNNIFVNKDTEVYWPNQYDSSEMSNDSSSTAGTTSVCIRSVKAILVNVTRLKEWKEKMDRGTRFVHRFPIEPHLRAFDATPYDICCSGYPTWRAFPYGGFGVYPKWNALKQAKDYMKSIEYRAQVYATDEQNVVEVAFPAEHQLHTGVYKLVVVAKVYAPGYNRYNLKTVTIDVPDVFELVSTSEEGSDTGFLINVSNVINPVPSAEEETYIPDVEDRYVRYGNLDGSTLLLNRTDDVDVDIDLSDITSWYDED